MLTQTEAARLIWLHEKEIDAQIAMAEGWNDGSSKQERQRLSKGLDEARQAFFDEIATLTESEGL